ncbi:hypothetical protein BDZ91DRAFT_799070 [Kalaharituber pfeilii]|nr:hypothetical protein BDZ91DRAFT_799070 [Kalaharituber pfeilii]
MAMERAFFLFFNNLNIYANVKTTRLENRGHQKNYTSSYMYFVKGLPESISWILREWVNRKKIQELRVEDFLVSEDGIAHMKMASVCHIIGVLKRRYGSDVVYKVNKKQNLGGSKKGDEIPGVPSTGERVRDCKVKYPVVRPLVLEKSEIFTLLTLDYNEAKVADCIDILKSLIKEVGLELDDRFENVIEVVKGDWLTLDAQIIVKVMTALGAESEKEM